MLKYKQAWNSFCWKEGDGSWQVGGGGGLVKIGRGSFNFNLSHNVMCQPNNIEISSLHVQWNDSVYSKYTNFNDAPMNNKYISNICIELV